MPRSQLPHTAAHHRRVTQIDPKKSRNPRRYAVGGGVGGSGKKRTKDVALQSLCPSVLRSTGGWSSNERQRMRATMINAAEFELFF